MDRFKEILDLEAKATGPDSRIGDGGDLRDVAENSIRPIIELLLQAEEALITGYSIQKDDTLQAIDKFRKGER